jgi:hypothetical protein
MLEKNLRNRKFSFGGTIHPFDSKEEILGKKSRDLFCFGLGFIGKSKEFYNPLKPLFYIPMHKKMRQRS